MTNKPPEGSSPGIDLLHVTHAAAERVSFAFGRPMV